MHHTIITIDIAHIGKWDPTNFLSAIDYDIETWPAEFEDWKVRVHQEHNGIITPVPGYTTPQGERV